LWLKNWIVGLNLIGLGLKLIKNMEEDNIYVTKEVIDDVEHSEIDFLIREEFGFDYDVHSEFVELEVGNPEVNSEPINIDLMITTLQELKEKGSTHVALHYHVDHIGYEMTGYKIYPSTEDQIKDYEGKLKVNQEKEDKLRNLREEMRRIQNG
jgi:hypothetical protein